MKLLKKTMVRIFVVCLFFAFNFQITKAETGGEIEKKQNQVQTQNECENVEQELNKTVEEISCTVTLTTKRGKAELSATVTSSCNAGTSGCSSENMCRQASAEAFKMLFGVR